MMILPILIFLSFVGLLISTYFTAVSYHWMRPDTRWVPRFCRMGQKTCSSIIFTPRARVFRVPNSLLGQIYYLALLSAAAAGLLLQQPFLAVFLGASLLTVALGAYLTFSLLFITRVPCPLCFTSHAINLVIFVILLFRAGGRWYGVA